MKTKPQKIRVIVADKPYSITVNNELEEQCVRAAAARIKDKMKELMQTYNASITDYLAMAALQIAIEREELTDKLDHSIERLQIQQLNQQIEQFLNEQ